MFDHAPSTPQLKPDTYATFDLRYVTESAETGVYNVKDVNRKTTFSSEVQEWESVKEHRLYCCFTLHSHSSVFNNEHNSYPKMNMKRIVAYS